ncbi:DNA-binding transcriptional regulator, AcrR family [Friedmanniella luteola]|uniref:DNA-binding transcriptional regulator, AcrR family n=1 Tax=Friedmanniella luteola TaxID=546871 RepID=A0A1H1RTI5_9ACTN|nr:TetR/AcrR family transcriptional regulator [Friedmanniella luteola]SDS39047.1 DNA-binding transcriptional regulator, AcrR family [Friedmanniella luteola]
MAGTSTTSGDGARPASKPSAARERILATASRLFYGVGIRAVGVDRVIAESEVARMTFFRHFPSKDDLVVAFLDRRVELARDELAQLRETAGAEWPRAVLAWVADGVATARETEGFRGCEFINTAAEFCDPDHPVRTIAAQHRAWIRDQMREALTELGHPTPASTAEQLLMLRTAAVIAASLEGFEDPDRTFTRTWWSLVA